MNRGGKMTQLDWKLECIGRCKEIDQEGESGSVGDSEEEGVDKEEQEDVISLKSEELSRGGGEGSM